MSAACNHLIGVDFGRLERANDPEFPAFRAARLLFGRQQEPEHHVVRFGPKVFNHITIADLHVLSARAALQYALRRCNVGEIALPYGETRITTILDALAATR